MRHLGDSSLQIQREKNKEEIQLQEWKYSMLYHQLSFKARTFDINIPPPFILIDHRRSVYYSNVAYKYIVTLIHTRVIGKAISHNLAVFNERNSPDCSNKTLHISLISCLNNLAQRALMALNARNCYHPLTNVPQNNQLANE